MLNALPLCTNKSTCLTDTINCNSNRFAPPPPKNADDTIKKKIKNVQRPVEIPNECTCRFGKQSSTVWSFWQRHLKEINKIDHSAAPFIDVDQSSGMTYSVILHKNVQKIRNSTRGRGVGFAGWGGREPRLSSTSAQQPRDPRLWAWKVHGAPAVKALGGSIKLASQDMKRKLSVWTFN